MNAIAPPVPSENLTRPFWTGDGFGADEYTLYNNAASVQLNESHDNSYLYSSGSGNPFTKNFSLSGGFSLKFEKDVVVTNPVFPTLSHQHSDAKIKIKLGAMLSDSESSGTPKNLTKSVTLSKSLTEQMSLQGGWEPRSNVSDPGDRRFIPANKGYALVKSATVNVFFVRLKGSKTATEKKMVPNPDIPEDWNIITFPINPKYVKNGTLDGRVGFVADPDFPQTRERNTVFNEQENSYFKPREAYAIKQRIEREEKRLESFFDRLNQRFVGAKVGRSDQLKGLGKTDNTQNVPDAPGIDWPLKHAKRNLVNTYVWSADLGFFAEENQTMDIREESLGASYNRVSRSGFQADVEADLGFAVVSGVSLETSVVNGENINVSITKNKEDAINFNMEVLARPDDLLNKWIGVDPDSDEAVDEHKNMDGFTLDAQPGKVQTYRFNSFYLAPHVRNWHDFFGKVVDPGWLHNSNEPDARALREARPHKNGVFKVMHRVTYVNRVPPTFLDAPVEELDEPGNVPDNVEDNTLIFDLVINALDEMAKTTNTNTINPTRENIGDAVYMVLNASEDGTSPWAIANIIPWWDCYWTPPSLTPAQETIRKNITEYMFKYYETVTLNQLPRQMLT